MYIYIVSDGGATILGNNNPSEFCGSPKFKLNPALTSAEHVRSSDSDNEDLSLEGDILADRDEELRYNAECLERQILADKMNPDDIHLANNMPRDNHSAHQKSSGNHLVCRTPGDSGGLVPEGLLSAGT